MSDPDSDHDLDHARHEKHDGPPKKLTPRRGKKELQRILKLETHSEWLGWLKSALVAPWWKELHSDCLSKSKSGKPAKVSQKVVLERLTRGEANGETRYSARFPEKDEWDFADHLARFVYMVKTENHRSNQGVFFRKNFPESFMEAIVWALLNYMRSTDGSSILGKRPCSNETKEEPLFCVDLEADEQVSDQLSIGEPEPIDLTIEKWREEMIHPRERIILTKYSPDFNPHEKYWQFQLISEALKRAEMSSVDEQIEDLGDLSTEQNIAWEPTLDHSVDDLDPPVNSQVDHFDPIKIAATADLEASMAAEIDASDFESSTLIIPTEESLERFEQHRRMLDNYEYQINNHEEACQVLKIANPRTPRMRSMNRSVVLKFWQPVAIARLLDIRANTKVRGAILGDSVGLGKTWVAIAVMLKIWEDYNQSVKKAMSEGKELPPGKPFLVVMPPSLIMQWCAEITRVTDKLQLVLYYGHKTSKEGIRPVKTILHKEDELFDGSPVNGRKVVITSYQTLSNRHGPAAVKTWCRRTNQVYMEDIPTPPNDFPHLLDGCFSDVIVDEGHTLRNSDTSQSRAVHWLKANFYLLLTATPIYNSREDVRGYIPLLFRPPSQGDMHTLKKLGRDIFKLPPEDPARNVCCTKRAVEEYILDNKVTPVAAGERLRVIFGQIMVRRTLSSRMESFGSRMIGSDIPPTHRRVCTAVYSRKEHDMYTRLSAIHHDGLFMEDPRDPTKIVWNMGKLRKLCLLTSWLGFHYLEHVLHAPKIPRACKDLEKGTLGAVFARTIVGEMKPQCQESIYQSIESIVETRRTWVLEFLLKGSPKMRAMLPVLRDQVIVHGEKAMVWTQFPAEQIYVAAVLKEANIDAEVFHAGLTRDERMNLVERFTQKHDECMVLICAYNVNAAGMNLQNLCRNVHILSMGLSKSVVNQAIGRVSRLGQERMAFVYEYRLRSSFDEDLVSRSERKALPGLVADLGEGFTFPSISEGEEGLTTRWVLRAGELYQLAPGELIRKEDIAESRPILEKLMRSMEDTI
ncbi:DNA repair helicase rad5 [Aspergillus arachidicola]|uniref:DNA repair helicase rad5 n=1 Tax=Aspergillus arachidicola TaxID=656916 RepID=A0A2G7FNJ6_9EURO|nr:DNA repair helicase rad5 [Aspergillus arachidicola]